MGGPLEEKFRPSLGLHFHRFLFLSSTWGQELRKRRPLQGSKSPKSGKEGFGVKKLPFPSVPEMGALSQKIPVSLHTSTRRMGIFRLKAPISGTLGNGSFLTPKPSFPDFGDFDPCRRPSTWRPRGIGNFLFLGFIGVL